MDSAVNPSILVVSSSSTKPKSLIKLITKATDEELFEENSTLVKYQWQINTKYYSAEVNVFGLEEDFERNDQFNDNVEALIIHMDSNKECGLEDLSKWDGIQIDCNLEVKLLVSNYCTENTKISKSKALEWCLSRGFEFIELYPSEDQPDNEDFDDFQEKIGVERIVEALEAHMWPNLVLKTNKKIVKNKKTEETDKRPNKELKQMTDDTLADDFTELFSQLNVMKDNLQSMPMNQRKQCAEQMVTAFWKAIGGEEEEIFDL